MGKIITLDEMDDREFKQRCYDDPVFFMESCLQIVPKDGKRTIPVRLNREQLEVLGILWKQWAAGKPVRLIILKARQLGISTLIELFIYWYTSTREQISAMVLSHEEDSARHILEMSKLFSVVDLRRQRGCMPMQSHSNRAEIVFDNPDWKWRAKNRGLGSKIRIATAAHDSVGHSQTIQLLHGSEVARWKDQRVLAGVMNAMSDSAETLAVQESTANGMYGLFYDTWVQAAKGENEWTPIFLPWKGRPEYRAKEHQVKIFEPTSAELKLMQLHDLDLYELCWRRYKINSPACQGQGRPPEDVFREQYPLTPEEAFQTSGKSYFDMGAVITGELGAKQFGTPVQGELLFAAGELPPLKASRESPPRVQFSPLKEGRLKIWRAPYPGHDYVIGADVGAGLQTGDFSVAYVLDRLTREIVACWAARITPEKFADHLVALAWYYNEAFLAPEANNLGLAVARKCAKHYRRLCYATDLASIAGETYIDAERPGWYTTTANRKHMVAYIREAVGSGLVRIYDPGFWEEAKTFEVPENARGEMDEGKPRAASGRHDDRVMAAAITLWVDDPMISGPVRKAPAAPEAPAKDWREAEMREFNKRTKQQTEKGQEERYIDEHLGEW